MKMKVLCIEIESPHCERCSYVFEEKRLLFGRSPRSQVCFPDLRMSLEHVLVTWSEEGYLEILDTYSKSGVWGGEVQLKPGQAYRAEHQVMLRFLDYRISLSLSSHSIPPSSSSDLAKNTARLAQSQSGWILKRSGSSPQFWSLPLNTQYKWTTPSGEELLFHAQEKGVSVRSLQHSLMIDPLQSWKTEWGSWVIFPLSPHQANKVHLTHPSDPHFRTTSPFHTHSKPSSILQNPPRRLNQGSKQEGEWAKICLRLGWFCMVGFLGGWIYLSL